MTGRRGQPWIPGTVLLAAALAVVPVGEASAQSAEAGAVTINWGVFINALISFLLVALVLFMIIRNFNRLKKAEEEAPEAPPEPSAQEVLLGEIRDLLKQNT